MDIFTIIKTISDSRKALSDYKSVLGNDLSKLDSQVNNIYHIIEISSLNAVQFTKLSYKLKEVLVKRREIKEQMIMIEGCLKDNKSIETTSKESAKRLERYSRECKQGLANLI